MRVLACAVNFEALSSMRSLARRRSLLQRETGGMLVVMPGEADRVGTVDTEDAEVDAGERGESKGPLHAEDSTLRVMLAFESTSSMPPRHASVGLW